MKVLLLSDSHGNNINMEKAIRKENPDLIIHMGDLEGAESFLEEIAPCPVEMVSGNCDFFSRQPRVKIVELGKYRAFVTHGHLFCVNSGYADLAENAKNNDCQIAIFGHIHRPVVGKLGGITVINPGSISYPRQDDRKASYAIMDFDANGEFSVTIEYA